MTGYSKPYAYKVINQQTNEFYVGSQITGKIIGVDYFTSSSNKAFRDDFEQNTNKYKIIVLASFADKEECILQENIQIRNSIWMYKEICLNKSYTCKEGFWKGRTFKKHL